MEDQLVALGERWAHICQWAEERWSKLHSLITHCTRIKEDTQKIESWLEANETLIKQMESEPVSELRKVLDRMKHLQVWDLKKSRESGKWCGEHWNRALIFWGFVFGMQSIRRQMGKQQKMLTNLQESVQITFDEMKTEESRKDMDRIEMLQDKMDALLQIVEMQAHRVPYAWVEFFRGR